MPEIVALLKNGRTADRENDNTPVRQGGVRNAGGGRTDHNVGLITMDWKRGQVSHHSAVVSYGLAVECHPMVLFSKTVFESGRRIPDCRR